MLDSLGLGSRFVVPLVCALATVAPLAAGDVSAFDRDFVDATLRVDFYHVGNAKEELVTLDRLYRQGSWAGSRTPLRDDLGVGRYVVTVKDRSDGRLLFERAFDSYFGEYRSTSPAAEGQRRTYHETVLVPFPLRPVQLSLSSRERNGSATVLGTFTVDPADAGLSREPAASGVIVVEAHRCADPHACADFAILGEGYTAAEEPLFRADLERFTALLLATPPYAAASDRIAVRGALLPSAQSGCDEPGYGVFRDTALGASFDALGSERYLLTEDNRALRDVAANVPYDALLVMVNHSRYGGGGIYNLFCTFTAHNQWSSYLMLHELAHSFGGLADEYYTSAVAYNDAYPKGVEPAEPNITALADPAHLKWADLATRGVAIPTPWEKAGFDELDLAYQKEREELNRRIAEASRSGAPREEVEKLKQLGEERSLANNRQVKAYFAHSAYSGVVGAFEGAGYSSTGLYRPMLDCKMFSRGETPFCAVCERALARMLEHYSE